MPPCAGIECARQGLPWMHQQPAEEPSSASEAAAAEPARPGHNHAELALVGRVYQRELASVDVPLLLERARRNAGLQFHASEYLAEGLERPR